MSIKREKWVALLAVLVSLGLLIGAAPLLAGSDPTATVTLVEGKAAFKVGKADYQPLTKGASLTAHTTVRTYKGAKVELTLPDKSVLRIAPMSVVKLESLLKSAKKDKTPARFKITAGKIWSNVSKAVGGEKKYEVTTETAVAGVRGTVFQVAVGDDQATLVRVYSGAVAVSNAPIYQRKPQKEGERHQVQGPQEVTQQQWEELVAKEMQQVRVTIDGVIKRTEFKPDPSDTAWEQWNLERDKKLGVKR